MKLIMENTISLTQKQSLEVQLTSEENSFQTNCSSPTKRVERKPGEVEARVAVFLPLLLAFVIPGKFLNIFLYKNKICNVENVICSAVVTSYRKEKCID